MKNILTLLAVIILNSNFSQTISFIQAPGSPITNNSNEMGFLSKDLNNDGFKDLIVGNAYSTNLYIYLGLGTGQFINSSGSPITSVNGPISSAVGDFNSDNIPDIVTANYNSGSISILLGTGTGSFTTAFGSPITMGAQPYCVDVADYNMDGKMDIIEVNAGSNNIILLLGNGTGSFSLASGFPISAGGSPYHVSAGFFNSDNFPDFAVANGNGNTVNVYLGTGTTIFNQAQGSPYATGTQPRTIAVKDLNNDNYPDMVIPNYYSSDLTILLGSSTGSFTSAQGSPISVNSSPFQCVVSDINLDGIQDIASANSGNQIVILYGSGNGVFSAAPGSPISVGNLLHPMCGEDFNNDNKPDLAVGDWNGSQVNVLLNKTLSSCILNTQFTYTAGFSGLVNFNSTSTGTNSSTSYSWYFGDGTNSTGTPTNHNYSNSGSYTVTLLANNNFTPACVNSSTQIIIVEIDPTAIIEQSVKNNVNVFPNPTSGILEINTNNLNDSVEFVIYSLLGQEILRDLIVLEKSTINLNTMENGIYYYKIINKGNFIKSDKIILNK